MNFVETANPKMEWQLLARVSGVSNGCASMTTATRLDWTTIQ